ncbi:hypothetical protein B0H10DRAFT_2441880 [Mycena sp. CBHHK59/15]|nr:hypothetical protein B0H10DRAFT_2441880 [Mycena sp. CBHHK59/15]
MTPADAEVHPLAARFYDPTPPVAPAPSWLMYRAGLTSSPLQLPSHSSSARLVSSRTPRTSRSPAPRAIAPLVRAGGVGRDGRGSAGDGLRAAPARLRPIWISTGSSTFPPHASTPTPTMPHSFRSPPQCRTHDIASSRLTSRARPPRDASASERPCRSTARCPPRPRPTRPRPISADRPRPRRRLRADDSTHASAATCASGRPRPACILRIALNAGRMRARTPPTPGPVGRAYAPRRRRDLEYLAYDEMCCTDAVNISSGRKSTPHNSRRGQLTVDTHPTFALFTSASGRQPTT